MCRCGCVARGVASCPGIGNYTTKYHKNTQLTSGIPTEFCFIEKILDEIVSTIDCLNKIKKNI